MKSSFFFARIGGGEIVTVAMSYSAECRVLFTELSKNSWITRYTSGCLECFQILYDVIIHAVLYMQSSYLIYCTEIEMSRRKRNVKKAMYNVVDCRCV